MQCPLPSGSPKSVIIRIIVRVKTIEKRVRCDIHYLENWSFWLDMKIIWLTVFGRKAHKDAY